MTKQNENINLPEDEDTLVIPKGVKLHRIYDMKPYTFYRMQRIYQEVGMHLENVWQGYKSNRRPGYKEIYDLIDDATGETILKQMPLDHYRRILARLDYPLYDEKSTAKDAPKPPKEDPNARQFRETVAAKAGKGGENHG